MSDNEFSSCDDERISTVIDTELLIKEIERRPALYNKQLKEYSDRNVKEKLWAEFCIQIFRNRNELAVKEKKIKKSEVQKKWKNLKDCFLREMAAQRKTVSGQGQKNRRKYIHFDEMLFLVPFVKGRETSSNLPCTVNNEEEALGFSECQSTSNANCNNTSFVEKPSTPVMPIKKNKPSDVTSYEQSLLNILQAKQSDELNEDKNFALMLVPMLKKLNEEQKHYAKVEILNVMRNARNFNFQQHLTFPPSSSYHLPPIQNQYPPMQINPNPNLTSLNNTGSLNNFYSEFANGIVSPSSASGSDIFDLSKQ